MVKTRSQQKKHLPTRNLSLQTEASLPLLTSPNLIAGFCLFIVAIALYSNTFGHGYVVDDAIVITKNTLVQKGIQGIPEILRHGPSYGWKQIDDSYRPLSHVTFAIEISLFGKSPVAHHVVNVLLYGFTGALLFFLLLELFRDKHWLFAFLIALLFVVHPIHTEK